MSDMSPLSGVKRKTSTPSEYFALTHNGHHQDFATSNSKPAPINALS